jgi:hypothetical protein
LTTDGRLSGVNVTDENQTARLLTFVNFFIVFGFLDNYVLDDFHLLDLIN